MKYFNLLYIYISTVGCVLIFWGIKLDLIYIKQTGALNIPSLIHCHFESMSGFLFDTVPVCLGNSNLGR